MEPQDLVQNTRRVLRMIWLAMLGGIFIQVLVVFLFLSRMFSHPMEPPAPVFSQGMKIGFAAFILGAWIAGYLMARTGRSRVRVPAGPATTRPQWDLAPERVQRMTSLAIASWAFFEAGILIALVYWILTRDWATILPPLVLHAGALLYFGPGYFLPRGPDPVAP